MAVNMRRVTEVGRGNRLPKEMNEFAVLAPSLEAVGFFEEVDRQLPMVRRGGFGAAPVVAYLLAFFMSGARGLRPFYEEYREWWPELAALCGLRRLPSSASMSRAMTSLGVEEVRRFGAWLLQAVDDQRVLLEAPGAATVAGDGRVWQVLDFDPTVDAYRQRALPEGEDLPEPQRRLGGLAAPGYPGRKRGEVLLAKDLLQHSGTGLWLGASIAAGNGQTREEFQRTVNDAVRWAVAHGIEPAQVVVRFDGGVGSNVPTITACREGGVHFLSRLSRYELLDLENAAAFLETAEWFAVEDSGSGPKREAAEFGTVTLRAKPETRRVDGRPYSAVTVRVVVSRFVSHKKGGAGVCRGGYQYELFAADLLPDDWPAPAVVTGYYGRCGQENRFAQEDRELALGRLFCCEPGGQLLAIQVGLFLWNLRTTRGARLLGAVQSSAGTDDVERSQGTRSRADQPSPPDDGAFEGTFPDVASSPDQARATATSNPRDVEVTLACAPGAPAPARAGRPCTIRGSSRWLASLTLIACLSWASRLRAGWRFDQRVGLICPNDQHIPLYRISEIDPESVAIHFRAPGGTCRKCPLKPQCTSSLSARFRKEVQVTARVDEFENAQALKTLLAGDGPPALPNEVSVPRWRPPEPPKPQIASCQWPSLLPSVFRNRHRAAAKELDVTINFAPPPPRIAPPKWLANGPADRQHRRHTYAQRYGRNRLPDDAVIDIHYEVRSTDGRRMLELQ